MEEKEEMEGEALGKREGEDGGEEGNEEKDQEEQEVIGPMKPVKRALLAIWLAYLSMQKKNYWLKASAAQKLRGVLSGVFGGCDGVSIQSSCCAVWPCIGCWAGVC